MTIRPHFGAGAGHLLLPALALLGAILVAGCAASAGEGGGPTGAPVATTTVDLPRSYRFDPSAITVKAGSTVTWTNHDAFTHTVRLPGGGEPLMLAPDASVSHVFATPGLYAYDCSLHPRDMTGTVLVTAG